MEFNGYVNNARIQTMTAIAHTYALPPLGVGGETAPPQAPKEAYMPGLRAIGAAALEAVVELQSALGDGRLSRQATRDAMAAIRLLESARSIVDTAARSDLPGDHTGGLHWELEHALLKIQRIPGHSPYTAR